MPEVDVRVDVAGDRERPRQRAERGSEELVAGDGGKVGVGSARTLATPRATTSAATRPTIPMRRRPEIAMSYL